MEKCGIFLSVKMFGFFFFSVYIYLWEDWWTEIQGVMQYGALPCFHNMGQIIQEILANASSCPICVFVPFSPVYHGCLLQTTLEGLAFNSVMNLATIVDSESWQWIFCS